MGEGRFIHGGGRGIGERGRGLTHGLVVQLRIFVRRDAARIPSARDLTHLPPRLEDGQAAQVHLVLLSMVIGLEVEPLHALKSRHHAGLGEGPDRGAAGRRDIEEWKLVHAT